MRSAFLFFVCKAHGTMKSWSMKRFPSHYSQPHILCKLRARLRSKPEQPQRMLKSNIFCYLVLPLQLLHYLSKALIKWTALESKHLPITTLKQLSSMEQSAEENALHKVGVQHNHASITPKYSTHMQTVLCVGHMQPKQGALTTVN